MKMVRSVPSPVRNTRRDLSIRSGVKASGAKHETLKYTGSHSPRLDTIVMVENAIRNKQVFESKHQLWRNLPRGMQYPILTTILRYLEDSNKIVIEDGRIMWTFVETPAARKSLDESVPL